MTQTTAPAETTKATLPLRAHPIRERIMDVMRSHGQPISPTRLAEAMGTSLGSTSYHVRTLVAAGFLELAAEGRVRGAVEHFYRVTPDREGAPLTDPLVGLLGLCGCLTLPSANGGFPEPVVLDEEGRAELQHLLDGMRPRVERVARAVVRRRLAVS